MRFLLLLVATAFALNLTWLLIRPVLPALAVLAAVWCAWRLVSSRRDRL